MRRVQRRRGVALPPGAVYVGRPTRWGNPYRIGGEAGEYTRAEALRLYRMWAEDTRRGYGFLDPLRRATALACWCPLEQACHADVLIELLEASA